MTITDGKSPVWVMLTAADFISVLHRVFGGHCVAQNIDIIAVFCAVAMPQPGAVSAQCPRRCALHDHAGRQLGQWLQ